MLSTRCSSHGDRTSFGENQGTMVMHSVSVDGATHSGRLETASNSQRSWWRLSWLLDGLSRSVAAAVEASAG
jgi:hypothetical protein